MCQGIVLTPNRPEARALLESADPHARGDLAPEALAQRLFAQMAGRNEPCRGLVLKGGHGGEDPVRALVLDAEGAATVHTHPRRTGGALHGSGCRHASALAANLANGLSLSESAARAGAWLGERFLALP
jgi:hydroxymethylpyrimidine/phosphomethylpyrimidine kinase